MSPANRPPGADPGADPSPADPAPGQGPGPDDPAAWTGAALGVHWFYRTQAAPPGTAEPGGTAPAATGPGSAGPGQDPPGQESPWYGPQGPVLSWDGPQPRPQPPAGLPPRPRHPQGPGSRPRRGLAAAAPAVVVVAVAALALVILTGHGPAPGLAASTQASGQVQPPGAITLPGYPGEQQRGVFRAVSRIVAAGKTIVAIGSQAGGGVVRQQFITSADAGRTWHLAPVRTPDGRRAPAGYAAELLAGGPQGWMAEGPHAIWTSRDGLSWTLAATHGISPREPGDSVWVVTRTGQGFLAAGSATDGRAGAQAVIWTSPDGLSWHRMTAAQAGLAGPGETVRNIAYASWRGSAVVISGDVARSGAAYDGVWLSTDSGMTWTRVTVPAGHGSRTQVSGLAASTAGLIAVRPGQSASGTAEGVAYFSPDGRTWRYAATIGAGQGWTPGVVKGSGYGFVVTGTTASGEIAAYTSTGAGRTWLPTGPLGTAAAESVASATVLPGGTAVAVGSTAAGQLGQQPVFLEAAGTGAVRHIPVPGSVPETTVRGTAAGAGQQIAVGSADGFPAVWRAAPGSPWRLVTTRELVSAYPGLRSLSSVTYGPAGWLAVGAPGPVVLTSADGVNWRAAAGGIAEDLAGVGAPAAAAGPAGYVIAGTLTRPGGISVAGLWWSADLIRWTRARDVDLAGGPSQVLAVAAGAHGFVSAGSHEGRPAVWVTADGGSWTAIVLPLPAGAAGGVLQQIAVDGRRVVALGQAIAAGRAAPLAEVSADGGTTWRQVPFAAPGPDTEFTGLAGSQAGFTAAGRAGGDAVAWTSATGARWRPSRAIGPGGPGTWEIMALARSGTAVIAIAGRAAEDGQQFIVRRL